MRQILILSLILISFVSGIFLGDRLSTDSRAYFDAAGTIDFLSFMLDQEKGNEWISAEIITQVRILNEPELTPLKSALFLQVTGMSELVSAHEKYISIIKDNTQYKEKMQFLCKHNESYSGKCN